MEKSKYGIQETEEGFDAAIAIVEAVEISKRDDGKVTFPGDLVNFVGAMGRVIRGVEGGNKIPRELSDLDDSELARLTIKFGELVNDERYQRVFFGLATASDAIGEIIASKNNELPAG